MGGCMSAEFKIEGNKKNVWDMLNALRCPVEVYYDNQLVWYGYIDNVKLSMGAYSVGVDLTNMANKVAVTYSRITDEGETFTRATTEWAIDTVSIAEYGTKELPTRTGA
jgi:hypothetical protein